MIKQRDEPDEGDEDFDHEEEKKLWLIDWGAGCSVGRYAIIRSTWSYLELAVDSIGDGRDVRFVEVASDNSDEMFYLELPESALKIEEETHVHQEQKTPSLKIVQIQKSLEIEGPGGTYEAGLALPIDAVWQNLSDKA